MTLTSLYAWLFLGSGLVAVTARFVLDANHRIVFREDGIIEFLGAALFLCASIIAIVHCLRDNRKRLIGWWIALLGLVAFLEETSYGIRWIGDGQMIQIQDYPFDGLHDFLSFVITGYRHGLASTLLIGAIMLAGIFFVATAYLYRQRIICWLRTAWMSQPTRFLMIAVGLIIVSLFLDAPIIRYKPLYLAEECLEMQAGLALLFAGVSLGLNEDGGRRTLQ